MYLIKRVILKIVLLFAVLHTNLVWAIGIDAGTMMQNLSTQIPELMKFVTALGYVLGFGMVIKGLLELKKYGEMRTQMSTSAELKGALFYLFVGAALIYLPTSVHVGMSTFWTHPNPYQYMSEAQEDPWASMINNVFMIIQLIGTISFIRGLMILAQAGGHGGQPGQIGKAMAHIIGGIFCINIYQFVQVVMNTLMLGQ